MRSSVCKGENTQFGKSEIATFRCYSEIVQANWKELKTSTYLQGSPRVIVIASTVDKHLSAHEAAAEPRKVQRIARIRQTGAQGHCYIVAIGVGPS